MKAAAQQVEDFLQEQATLLRARYSERSAEILVQGALLAHTLTGAMVMLNSAPVSQARRVQIVQEMLEALSEKLNLLILMAVAPEKEVQRSMQPTEIRELVERVQADLLVVMKALIDKLDEIERGEGPKIILPAGGTIQ